MTVPDAMARRSGDPLITNNEILAELQMIPALRRTLVTHEVYLLTLLRERGCTWDEIGAALGMTRQGASGRYDRLVARRFQISEDD